MHGIGLVDIHSGSMVRMNLQGEQALAAALGITFHDPLLLRLALVHRSFIHERPSEAPESNERLEFLGDALLGLVIAHELYARFPDEPEGRLTEMRARLVRMESLAGLAAELDIGERLYLGRGEESSGGRLRQRNLASAVEAVLGAVLLDQGYPVARDLVVLLFTDALQSLAEEIPWNYKSLFQEAVQATGRHAPTYDMVAQEGPEHTKMFVVEVRIDGEVAAVGRGTSKQRAEQEAARAAYLLLKEQPEPDQDARE